MAINSSNNGTLIGCLTGIGKLLTTLVAGKDLHLRLVIARAARLHSRPANGPELNARWRARHDLAARLRAE